MLVLGLNVSFRDLDDSFRYNNQLRVLDDTEKGNWSKHFWNIKSVWGTDTCEIVWVKWPWIKPCYVYYYNVERQSVRRVYIQGIDDKVFAILFFLIFIFAEVKNLDPF